MIESLMPRALRATMSVLGTAALLIGCGDGDRVVVDRDATLRLTLTDYRIEPAELRVEAKRFPARIRIVVDNRGRYFHTAKILSVVPDGQEGVGRKPINFGGSEAARPGERASTENAVYLQPGSYRIACTISNHATLGEYGKLVVERAR